MLRNLIGSDWVEVDATDLPVFNPATADVIERVPLSASSEVDRAVKAAAGASAGWAATPVIERVRLMFRYKQVLEEHFEELAAIVTRHHGKTLDEARGEVRRGIEVVDFACGAPTLLQGRTLRQVTSDVDQDLYRYPLGVVAGAPPFNFPVMIPLWMFPLAVVAGNTFVLKPSERTPLGAVRLAELLLEAGFPPGVLNLVHGARETFEALIAHPVVRAVSFVGSAPAAQSVYALAAQHGKRVQALGGAKNHLIVMPDADLDIVVPAILNSAFGNAGERCLAGSVAVAVGSSGELLERVRAGAEQLRVGPGEDPGVNVGPLIRDEHRARVVQYIERGVAEGGTLVVDGREHQNGPGFFLGPTVIDQVSERMAVGRDEIFGPVLAVSRVDSLEAALAQANSMTLGNMAVIFTSSGRSARLFRERIEAGMIGVNVPVAQPFAFYPFSGWKGSFYGDLHVHGTDGIDFYTQKKVVVSRW
ncbi:MAG: CoA-acylating methylmalonate-semialdehyde dehydrogenase [Candidatus Dormibacteraeota bacterium]|nr:CoA-acylating methylmalonate-semialdehyde dehydrogenase [Candidatus Dormibacteraeota bacterium]